MNMHNAVWQLIVQSDFVSKCLLLVLFCISIVCWALTIYKVMIFRSKISQIRQALSLLQNIKNLDDFIIRASTIQDNFAGQIIAHYLTDFKTVLKTYENSLQVIAEKDWQMLQNNMMQTLDDALQKEESLVSVLSTSAQAAPLLGLFGTVWGLIHAFLAIGSSKSADISSVAPGIAEALITTLGGLVVAIPSLVMFNLLQTKLRTLEQHLLALADKCFWSMRSVVINAELLNKNQFNSATMHSVKRDIL